MELLPFELAAFVLSLSAFLLGAIRLFKPHVPMYFKLIYEAGGSTAVTVTRDGSFAGSIFGSGSFWIVLGCGVLFIGAVVTAIAVSKKRKAKKEQ